MAVQVDFAALDGTGTARDLQARLARARGTVAAAAGGLDDVRGREPVLDERPTDALTQAGEAYRRAHQAIDAAGRELDDVAARCAAAARRVEGRLAGVRAPLAPARADLETAEAVRAARAGEGLVDARVDELLVAGRAAWQQAGAAAATISGGPEVARLAGVVRSTAQQAVDRLELLRTLPTELPHRITAAHTRMQAVEGRLDGVSHALSELRRHYAAAAFADVEGADTRTRQALRDAGADLGAAARTLAHPPVDHERAAQQVQRARAALATADAAARGPVDRLAALDAVSRDPAGVLAASRHRLREAQRYLLQRQPDRPDPRLVERLDALAGRLDNAEELLRRPHPDWWSFLSTTNDVTDSAGRVIASLRGTPG